jgi:hypothetical protein
VILDTVLLVWGIKVGPDGKVELDSYIFSKHKAFVSEFYFYGERAFSVIPFYDSPDTFESETIFHIDSFNKFRHEVFYGIFGDVFDDIEVQILGKTITVIFLPEKYLF